MQKKVTIHKFDRNYNCNFFCERCCCCRHLEQGNGYNFSPDVLWRRLRTSHELYVAVAGDKVSPWMVVPGWSLYRNLYDTLHCIWLGFGKDVAGQLLKDEADELIQSGRASDLDDALRKLYTTACKELKEWTDYRLSEGGAPWNSKSIRSDEAFPSLKKAYKGHYTKSVVVWAGMHVIEKAKALHASGAAVDDKLQRKAAMCYHLLKFVELTDTGPLIFSTDQAELVAYHGNEFLLEYQWLKDTAFHAHQTAWRVRPKLHYFVLDREVLKILPLRGV